MAPPQLLPSSARCRSHSAPAATIHSRLPWSQNFYMSMKVGAARKKYGVTYPACYAPAGGFASPPAGASLARPSPPTRASGRLHGPSPLLTPRPPVPHACRPQERG